MKLILSTLAATLALCAVMTGCAGRNADRDTGADTGAPAGGAFAVIRAEDGAELSKLYSFDADGTELADANYSSYADIASREAVDVISELYGIDGNEAKEKIIDEGMRIDTFFDSKAHVATLSAYQYYLAGNIDSAIAVTDNSGRLLSAISFAAEYGDATNYASEPTPPYSSIKPLSVYAPALDKKLINWSTVFPDTPVKKVSDGEGGMKDWPTNAEGGYRERDVTVAYAVKLSLNTVAVKALLELTPRASMDFLEDSFNIDLSYEEYVSTLEDGEDNVLANIGLGYLYSGISPVDMAGCYTVFANGGVYTKPYAIGKITDSDGNVIYEASPEGTRVISEETAAIMREMLKLVTDEGGTGAEAAECGYEIGGKTGTGTGYTGNWFIGFCPSYTMSVWYGEGRTSNICPKIFSMAAGMYPPDEGDAFPVCAAVRRAAYCGESGGLLSGGCRDMEVGFFTSDNMPAECGLH